MKSEKSFGSIVWQDLTVPDAEKLLEFYTNVVGWKAESQSMGSYNDYNILDVAGNIVAGICHARGENSSLPPQWLIYVAVESVENAVISCREHGGEVIDGPRMMGRQLFCVIKDPFGAVLALIES